jgi:hypothetical protein
MEFRNDLEGYQRRHANDQDLPPRDYVAMFDAAFGAQLAIEIRIKWHVESLPPVHAGVWQRPDFSGTAPSGLAKRGARRIDTRLRVALWSIRTPRRFPMVNGASAVPHT